MLISCNDISNFDFFHDYANKLKCILANNNYFNDVSLL
jgi:hypothetical protein